MCPITKSMNSTIQFLTQKLGFLDHKNTEEVFKDEHFILLPYDIKKIVKNENEATKI